MSTSPPTYSPRTPSLSGTPPTSRPRHLRQRSSLSPFATNSYSQSESGNDADSDESSEYFPRYDEKDAASYHLLPASETEGLETVKASNSLRRYLARHLILLIVIAIVAVGGWATGILKWADTLEKAKKVRVLELLSEHRPPPTCNPYEQHGVLLVDLTVPSENAWLPISAPDTCQPVDYLSLLYANGEQTITPQLNFVRDRTIVIYGDSVDRDHNENFCKFAGGIHEMIGEDHVLSPDYPEGTERPPPGYKNFWTGERKWPNFPQSRPFVCHVARYNLRIVNVFHYGFRNETNYISNHPHFYPPASFEDRFDQIVVPIAANIGFLYNVSSIPDILSVTPGFWGLMRMSLEDDKIRDDLIKSGTPKAEADALYDSSKSMTQEQRDWFSRRIKESLVHVAQAWNSQKGRMSPDEHRSPKILWRPLHHIKSHKSISFNRLQTVDQIGRSVVEHLVLEGKAAQLGSHGWLMWSKRRASHLGWQGKQHTEDEALEGGLGTRLVIDEWGSLMLGQEDHFRDQVHPLPLPGSFLWGNMILQQLKQAVDEKEGKARRVLAVAKLMASEEEASRTLIPINVQLIESRSTPP